VAKHFAKFRVQRSGFEVQNRDLLNRSIVESEKPRYDDWQFTMQRFNNSTIQQIAKSICANDFWRYVASVNRQQVHLLV
jgi:hypothetical protein